MAHHVLQTSFARVRCYDAYGIYEALYSRTGDEMKMMGAPNSAGVIVFRIKFRCYREIAFGRLMIS